MIDFCELTLETKAFYGVNFSKRSDQITCIVFDTEGDLWLEVVLIAALIKRQKEQNPNLDCSEPLIDQTLLAAGCSASYGATIVDDCVHFTAKYYLANYPVTFLFFLARGTRQEVSRHYIKPLWRTLLRQRAEIDALVEELKRKDLEIAQYQAEGARLNRTTVQTVPFDEQTFRQEFPVQLPQQTVRIDSLLDHAVHRDRLMKTLELEQNMVNSSSGRSRQTPVPTTLGTPTKRRRKRVKPLSVAAADITKTVIEYENDDE
ncbi:non-homologous end-joining factor 1-like [Anopheles maculipalpis]|uniref:non-homologous end-joining factor 1-like n=1 Tax=Anopheles maculipalpis TaxID=1496333 RepID=UPI00215956CC|nr:non-homologous end-joining factor 1-like [Anopheles maculipalpis]